MVYLDYSATTPVNEEVLDSFNSVSKTFFANPNSLHKLGLDAKNIIDASTKQISDILKVKEKEIIYTSGATEANNMAIYGVLEKYGDRAKRIITTHLEHSSVSETLNYYEAKGYEIVYVKLKEDGTVDIESLEELLKIDTILVSISSVNSETGIRQDIDKIGKIIKKYPKTIFHSDVTQSIGKVEEDLSNVDLASFSAQKFYGIKGIGCLIKKENIDITPLIKGGKSTTIYRSGTPAVALIVSMAKALRLSYIDIDSKYKKVEELNKYLKSKLNNIENVIINSTDKSIPHIINLSIDKIKPETMLHALEQEEIYISTKTACSKGDYSEAVYSITNDINRASHSIRISISYLTTIEEIDKFIEVFAREMCKLIVLS